MTITEHMTTRQLARLWRVSEATIKRWADAGHLRPSRTLGGHRRFSLEEVARFQAERGLSQAAATKEALRRFGASETGAPPNVESEPRTVEPDGDYTEAFYESVASGREATASAVLLEAYLSGARVVELLDDVVAGALHRVGDEWEAGRVTVADEHLATRTATRAVETLRGSVRREGGTRGTAVCCAAEEELHELSVLCAQTLLESDGWTVRNLGGNTPFFALTDAVARHRPELVCISSTTRGVLAGAARDYAQFLDTARTVGARVVLGGEGFRFNGQRDRFPADLHASTLADLSDFLTR